MTVWIIRGARVYRVRKSGVGSLKILSINPAGSAEGHCREVFSLEI